MQILENVAENTNEKVWQNLKTVIIQSSGFQRWQATRASENIQQNHADDDWLVNSYLRDTLQTLAY